MRTSSANSLPALRLPSVSVTLRNVAGLLGLLRTRRQLRDLDDRSLQDIGVSRAEAEAESARPVWDVPQNWRL